MDKAKLKRYKTAVDFAIASLRVLDDFAQDVIDDGAINATESQERHIVADVMDTRRKMNEAEQKLTSSRFHYLNR